MLIDNELCRGKIFVISDQINGKKERSRKIDKTVKINAADILSNISGKIPDALTTNNSENAGVVATEPKASEDRKIGSDTTIANTTKQQTTTFTKVSNSECFECSTAVVSHL